MWLLWNQSWSHSTPRSLPPCHPCTTGPLRFPVCVWCFTALVSSSLSVRECGHAPCVCVVCVRVAAGGGRRMIVLYGRACVAFILSLRTKRNLLYTVLLHAARRQCSSAHPIHVTHSLCFAPVCAFCASFLLNSVSWPGGSAARYPAHLSPLCPHHCAPVHSIFSLPGLCFCVLQPGGGTGSTGGTVDLQAGP